MENRVRGRRRGSENVRSLRIICGRTEAQSCREQKAREQRCDSSYSAQQNPSLLTPSHIRASPGPCSIPVSWLRRATIPHHDVATPSCARREKSPTVTRVTLPRQSWKSLQLSRVAAMGICTLRTELETLKCGRMTGTRIAQGAHRTWVTMRLGSRVIPSRFFLRHRRRQPAGNCLTIDIANFCGAQHPLPPKQ